MVTSINRSVARSHECQPSRSEVIGNSPESPWPG